jgi:hypothetical protein
VPPHYHPPQPSWITHKTRVYFKAAREERTRNKKEQKRIQDARREGTVIRSDRKTHFRSLLCIKKVTDKPSEYNYSETYTISDAADL